MNHDSACTVGLGKSQFKRFAVMSKESNSLFLSVFEFYLKIYIFVDYKLVQTGHLVTEHF